MPVQPDDSVPVAATVEAPMRWIDGPQAGVGFGIFSAVAYTAANMALRQLAHSNDSGWMMWVTCMKAFPAALTAWTIIAYRASRGLPALPPRRLVLPMIAAGVMMQFGGNFFFQWALSLGGLALTVPLVFSTLISGAAVLSRFVLQEPITPRTLVSMLVLATSIALLSLGADAATESLVQKSDWGQIAAAVCIACTAGLAYGANGVVIRRVITGPISISATLVLLSTTGVVMFGSLSLYQLGPAEIFRRSAVDPFPLIAAGSFNAIAFFAVGASLKRITVTQTNLLNASQIAMAAVAGVIWFNEPLTVWLALGTILTGLGLILVDHRAPLKVEKST